MAVGVELYLVAGVGTVLIFILLGARPITRRMDEAIRRRTRELNEELKGQMTSSDMNERDQGKTQDD
jgi:Na+-transporting methylmalonyl-CoA/oxaloacetate decarboxylase gamma subunit